jgi:hypothetical protein
MAAASAESTVGKKVRYHSTSLFAPSWTTNANFISFFIQCLCLFAAMLSVGILMCA